MRIFIVDKNEQECKMYCTLCHTYIHVISGSSRSTSPEITYPDQPPLAAAQYPCTRSRLQRVGKCVLRLHLVRTV